MSALSKCSIEQRLENKDLVISPILSDGEEVGLSSVDLRMGTVVLVSRAGAQSHVDPRAYCKSNDQHAKLQNVKQKHDRFDIPFGDSFLLHPGTLALVPTFEWIKMPNDLQGIVTARSSWAREGLNIATATIINPSYKGIITLELANFGEIPIKLYPGLRLAQIAFYELKMVDGEKEIIQAGSQFNMNFEPSGGNLARGDEQFIPKLIVPDGTIPS